MNLRPLVAILAIVNVAACSKDHSAEQPKDAGRRIMGPPNMKGPAEITSSVQAHPIVPAPRNAAVPGVAAWYATLPRKAVDAKAGDIVWALHELPGDRATLEVVEVVSVEGDTATVARLGTTPAGKLPRSPRGEQYAHVPGAAIRPAHTVTEANAHANDWLVTYRYGEASPLLARAKTIDNGIATVEHAVVGKVRQEKLEYGEVLVEGVAPLTWVAMPESGAWKRVAVATIEGDTVYGVDASLHFAAAKLGDCKPLAPQLKERKVGDKVTVFPIVGSSRVEVIRRVELPSWVFYTSETEPITFDRIYDGI